MATTKLPSTTEFNYFYWKQCTLTSSLAASASVDDIRWTVKPTDDNGTIIDGAFLMGVTNRTGQTELIWVPSGEVSADGYSAANVKRGIKPYGDDYTTTDADFIYAHEAGSKVFCAVAPQIPTMLVKALQGLIATGSANFIIGTDAAGTVTIKRSSGTGTSLGFLRYNNSTGKAEYSNDGSTWNSIDSVTASNLLVVTGADTTPSNLQAKTSSGTGITRSVLSPGANERLEIATSYTATPTEINQALAGISANVTAANLNTLNAGPSSNADDRHTHDGFLRNTNFTASEALLQGDVVDSSGTDAVTRHAPTAFPSSFTSASGGAEDSRTSSHAVRLVKLSSTVYGLHCSGKNGGVNGPRVYRLPITAATGATGTPAIGNGPSTAGTALDSVDAVKAGTDKLMTVASQSNSIYARVCDLSSTVSSGTEVAVDTSNCRYAACDYISDSHVLVIYQDTSASSIVFVKYTLAGTTLTLSSNATITTPTGTFVFQGARRFSGTDYFLLVVQNSTDGSAECAVATYDEGTSSFTSTGSWYHFPSDADINGNVGVNFVQISDTLMMIAFKTTTTNVGVMLVTRSGTVLSFGTIINTTTGANGGFSLTAYNARSALLSTINSSTVTMKVIEIAAGGDLTTRLSGTITPSTTIQADNFCIGAVINPTMTAQCYQHSTGAIYWESGSLTFNPEIGIASAAAAAAASVSILTSGYSDDVSGLTAATRYYADLGGLLTSTSYGSPEKVGVAKDATELIIKTW